MSRSWVTSQDSVQWESLTVPASHSLCDQSFNKIVSSFSWAHKILLSWSFHNFTCSAIWNSIYTEKQLIKDECLHSSRRFGPYYSPGSIPRWWISISRSHSSWKEAFWSDSSSSPHEISPTTLSPVASPTLYQPNYSSKSAKPTISPTSNPTSSPTNSPTSRYSLVGSGHCLDSSNKKYSWTSVAISNASDQDCINWCDLVPSSKLVGVSIEDSDTSDARCYCNFKGGLIPTNVLLDVIHYSPQLDQIKFFKGRGAVETFSSDSGVMCYKAVWFGILIVGHQSSRAYVH
jgi:hypothetical protein